jgi:hypothetical protein
VPWESHGFSRGRRSKTSRYDLGEVNTVAEKLEKREIDGRAVITP